MQKRVCFLFAPSLAGLHPPVVLHTAAPQEGSALCLGVAQEPQKEAGGHGVARPKRSGVQAITAYSLLYLAMLRTNYHYNYSDIISKL